MEDYDLSDEETRPAPDCEDCGRFRVLELNVDKQEWLCPYCEPEDEEDE